MSEGRAALPLPRVTLAFTGVWRGLDAIQKPLQLGQITLHGIKDDVWVGPAFAHKYWTGGYTTGDNGALSKYRVSGAKSISSFHTTVLCATRACMNKLVDFNA